MIHFVISVATYVAAHVLGLSATQPAAPVQYYQPAMQTIQLQAANEPLQGSNVELQ
ncbi:MAG TPA: hypothetical protein VFH39_04525 [Candidatus Saccharimonadales bacterium]|nr:hypothetical protein [Candidatus Saccharimonadales bacterium]